MSDETATGTGTGLTPCIVAAMNGIVGDCLRTPTYVSSGDARWVAYDPSRLPSGYVVDPNIQYTIQLEFSTFEQAQALQALLEKRYPGSTLAITDYVSNFIYPPFRKIQYLNDGGLYSPRLYEIKGTLNLPEGPTPTEIHVGDFINRKGVIMGGLNPYTEQLGYPAGNVDIVIVGEMGMGIPEWVGGPKQ
jgi:hypothetical protein